MEILKLREYYDTKSTDLLDYITYLKNYVITELSKASEEASLFNLDKESEEIHHKINVILSVIKLLENNKFALEVNRIRNMKQNKLNLKARDLIDEIDGRIEGIKFTQRMNADTIETAEKKLKNSIRNAGLDLSIYEHQDVDQFFEDYLNTGEMFKKYVDEGIKDEEIIYQALGNMTDTSSIKKFIDYLKEVIEKINHLSENLDTPLVVDAHFLYESRIFYNCLNILKTCDLDIAMRCIQTAVKKQTDFYKCLPDAIKSKLESEELEFADFKELYNSIKYGSISFVSGHYPSEVHKLEEEIANCRKDNLDLEITINELTEKKESIEKNLENQDYIRELLISELIDSSQNSELDSENTSELVDYIGLSSKLFNLSEKNDELIREGIELEELKEIVNQKTKKDFAKIALDEMKKEDVRLSHVAIKKYMEMEEDRISQFKLLKEFLSDIRGHADEIRRIKSNPLYKIYPNMFKKKLDKQVELYETYVRNYYESLTNQNLFVIEPPLIDKSSTIDDLRVIEKENKKISMLESHDRGKTYSFELLSELTPKTWHLPEIDGLDDAVKLYWDHPDKKMSNDPVGMVYSTHKDYVKDLMYKQILLIKRLYKFSRDKDDLFVTEITSDEFDTLMYLTEAIILISKTLYQTKSATYNDLVADSRIVISEDRYYELCKKYNLSNPSVESIDDLIDSKVKESESLINVIVKIKEQIKSLSLDGDIKDYFAYIDGCDDILSTPECVSLNLINKEQ